jgi:hypothetical protein
MKCLVAVAFALFALTSLCPAQSDSPPYEEVHAKIRRLTDRQLIDCLSEKHIHCPLGNIDRDSDVIAWELRDRKHTGQLISAYATGDQLQRYYLVQALWQMNDPKVLAFMRSIAFENLPSGQDNADVFFPLDYLAQRCDERALARLNRRVNFDKSFPVGCIYWAPTMEAFVRCNYRPASQNFVLSLHAACGNITDAAEHGLRKFFPGACKQAHSIEEQESCYTKLLQDSPVQPQ